MDYYYFNQNNYGHVPYPSPSSPGATVKTGGCGPTCAAMIVSNMTGKVTDPKEMAAYAIEKKARVAGGTDMHTLARAIATDYGLAYTTTNDELALLEHLRSGGMAIANVGGDRPGYKGVFSNAGHYVVVAGIAPNGSIIVLDPGYYAGKYNKPGRKGKVTLWYQGSLCSISVLGQDTANRSPSYWLFERRMAEVPTWITKIIDEALAAGLITERHNPTEPVQKWFVLAIALNTLKILRGGK